MFHGLWKSKFLSKCKSDIKLTKNRIEIIKKKRNAMLRFLRNDIADLLRNGLDTNAYGRAEGLIAEMNRSSCYDFIEQHCEDILNHVATMNRERECPEECKEAVASLMFASARIADLPELRHLRTLFSERYGSGIDCYVNKEFCEKLKSGRPSKDEKLQLLQEIAAESGLDWNAKALENELYKKSIAKKTNDEEYAREIDHARDHIASPVGDIQMDTIGRTKNTDEPASRRNVPNEEQKDNSKRREYGLIPPPYTKTKSNKPTSSSSEAEEDYDREAKPKPKSVRRRSSKPPNSSSDSDEKEKLKDKDKAAAQQGQRILKFFDRGGGSDQEEDEEEKMMDKLLRHYSRKKDGKKGEAGQRNKDVPGRTTSLPGYQHATEDTSTKHTRSASLEANMFSGKAHVHPKLPDYDDFVARLAAYRGE